jgi:hypothetical protein
MRSLVKLGKALHEAEIAWAIFLFKAGMIPTLLACSAAGVLLHLTGVV